MISLLDQPEEIARQLHLLFVVIRGEQPLLESLGRDTTMAIHIQLPKNQIRLDKQKKGFYYCLVR